MCSAHWLSNIAQAKSEALAPMDSFVFVERMKRTLRDECFGVQDRQTWYIGIAEIQRDLHRFLCY
jgi:hypothetical protein